ncbi:MAG: hypothetical protein ACI9WU_000095 [Myxococcota bacterium]|jgi:hypothetical protein
MNTTLYATVFATVFATVGALCFTTLGCELGEPLPRSLDQITGAAKNAPKHPGLKHGHKSEAPLAALPSASNVPDPAVQVAGATPAPTGVWARFSSTNHNARPRPGLP